MPQSKVQCLEVALRSVELFLNRPEFTVSRTRDIQSYRQVHQRATEMCDRLGTPLLWWKVKSWVCSTWRWEGLWGWLISVCKYLKESVKKTEPCCVQWCPLTGGNDTRRNTGHEDIRKHFFIVTDVFSPKKMAQAAHRAGGTSPLGDI